MNNKNLSTKLYLPFLIDLNMKELKPSEVVFFGRLKEDFLSDCLLFKTGLINALDRERVTKLERQGYELCYVYDVLDLENFEFTIEGYKAIRKDLDSIIKLGFSQIMLSNSYLIELVLNEYANKIDVIISSQLEINSERGRVFLMC